MTQNRILFLRLRRLNTKIRFLQDQEDCFAAKLLPSHVLPEKLSTAFVFAKKLQQIISAQKIKL